MLMTTTTTALNLKNKKYYYHVIMKSIESDSPLQESRILVGLYAYCHHEESISNLFRSRPLYLFSFELLCDYDVRVSDNNELS